MAGGAVGKLILGQRAIDSHFPSLKIVARLRLRIDDGPTETRTLGKWGVWIIQSSQQWPYLLNQSALISLIHLLIRGDCSASSMRAARSRLTIA